LKPAVLRPQTLRDQQGEVRYYRKEGAAPVAVRVVKATNAALDQIERDPGVSSYEEMQETLALLKCLAMGDREVDEGRVQPINEAVADLRAELHDEFKR
jgi:hypothetical protein